MEKEKDFWDMTNKDQQSLIGEATQSAIKKLHEKGLYSVQIDENGIYYLYPYEEKNIQKIQINR